MSSLIDFLENLIAPGHGVAGDDAYERIGERVLNAGGGNPYHDKATGEFASGPAGAGSKTPKHAGGELRAAASRAKRDSDIATEEATAVYHLHAASSYRRAALLHEAAGKFDKGERLREKAREHADEADAFMLDSGEPGPPRHPDLAERMLKSDVAGARGAIAGLRLPRQTKGPHSEISGAARQASDDARLASRFPDGRDPEAAHERAADLHGQAAAAHGDNTAGDDHRHVAALHTAIAGMYRAARERAETQSKVASLASSIAEDASSDAATEGTAKAHSTAAALHREAAIAHDEADEAALANSRDPSAHRAAARGHLERARVHDKRRSP